MWQAVEVEFPSRLSSAAAPPSPRGSPHLEPPSARGRAGSADTAGPGLPATNLQKPQLSNKAQRLLRARPAHGPAG